MQMTNKDSGMEWINLYRKGMTDFIWNDDEPKIKYDTLVGTYNKGGLTYPTLNQ